MQVCLLSPICKQKFSLIHPRRAPPKPQPGLLFPRTYTQLIQVKEFDHKHKEGILNHFFHSYKARLVIHIGTLDWVSINHLIVNIDNNLYFYDKVHCLTISIKIERLQISISHTFYVEI